MLTNHDLGFSFTHIPKCGGTWVRQALLAHVPGTQEETFGSDRHIGIHASPAEYDKLKCLVSIRDPLALYVSLFCHICRGDSFSDTQEWVGFAPFPKDRRSLNSLKGRHQLFQEWLPKIVSLDLRDDCWDIPCMNDTGSTTKYIRYMKDHRRDFGWCTYTLIYNTVRDWEDFIKNKKIDDFFECTNANYILKQGSLSDDMRHALTHKLEAGAYAVDVCRSDARNVRSELLNPDREGGIFSAPSDSYYKEYNHQEYLEWYTPELINLVKEKESFLYQLLEDDKVNERL